MNSVWPYAMCCFLKQVMLRFETPLTMLDRPAVQTNHTSPLPSLVEDTNLPPLQLKYCDYTNHFKGRTNLNGKG